MNTYIDVEQIKAHLNIDLDYNEEDQYLLELADVAVVAVENHIMRPLYEVLDEDGELPAPIRHACLLLIGNFYQNRESVAYAQSYRIPHGYEYLLQMYQNYGE